jgi:uncharacterized membrane protein
MRRFPLALFLLAMLATAAFVVATVDALPERIATHFGAAGVPDGWMMRAGYRRFMLVFIIALPLAIVALIGWLPRVRPRWINIPNREHWLAPARLDDTAADLLTRACWLGVLMEAFIAAIHYALLQANAASPPRLPTPLFLAMLVGFLAALGVWIALIYRRFRRP